MNAKDKKRLVKELAKNAAESIIKDIEAGKIPEDWDGIELRELFANRVKWHTMEKKRMRAYNNTVMVNGL